jgi:hypothetical protein
LGRFTTSFFIKIWKYQKKCLYLQTETKKQEMTAIQLRAELFREMSPLLDNESAMKKMLTFIRTLSPAKSAKAEAGWADRFVGAWKEDRSAEEIVSDIQSARTTNNFDVKL